VSNTLTYEYDLLNLVTYLTNISSSA